MQDQDSLQRNLYFNPLSGISRFIRMFHGSTLLSSGTCFFVMTDKGPILITNRHNFTGRNNLNDKPLHTQCGILDHAVVTLHGPHEVHYHIDLLSHKNRELPSWVEHPAFGSEVDVVALPVNEVKNIIGEINSISIKDLEVNWYRWDVGNEIKVIGYPFGEIGGPFPIWSNGSIASEPEVDIFELPIFLIDCKSRTGQSGSPVWAKFKKGDVVTHKGKDYMAKKDMYHFLGIYSGRFRADSDLGFVWKKKCILELVNHAISEGTQHKMSSCRHKFSVATTNGYKMEDFIRHQFPHKS